MKKIINNLLITTTLLTSMSAYSIEPSAALAMYSVVSVGLDATADCVYKNDSGACAFMIPISVVEVFLTVLLLKEMQEAKPDALAYSIDGHITPALQSTVEKIQLEARMQGFEVNFEDVINTINTVTIK